MTPQEKFTYGYEMTPEEVLELPLVDKCRYIVRKFFPEGFSVGEVTEKLNEFLDIEYHPKEVATALEDFYGKKTKGE